MDFVACSTLRDELWWGTALPLLVAVSPVAVETVDGVQVFRITRQFGGYVHKVQVRRGPGGALIFEERVTAAGTPVRRHEHAHASVAAFVAWVAEQLLTAGRPAPSTLQCLIDRLVDALRETET